jgi:hypothetical protein
VPAIGCADANIRCANSSELRALNCVRRSGDGYGPGTFVYMPDPHFEHEMTTKNGCTVVFLQYPGPTTGAPAIYDGRMNLKQPESTQEYDLNR